MRVDPGGAPALLPADAANALAERIEPDPPVRLSSPHDRNDQRWWGGDDKLLSGG